MVNKAVEILSLVAAYDVCFVGVAKLRRKIILVLSVSIVHSD